jgi:hypothetical protein
MWTNLYPKEWYPDSTKPLIHVIEKSDYDALLEQANKLAEALECECSCHSYPKGQRCGPCKTLADFEKWKAGE